ncbi:hypothetical protein CFC21_072625, partial [Triticum aestivum]
ANNAI